MSLEPNTLLVLATLLVGWLALLPLKNHLGWAIHVAAVPIGLLGWTIGISLTTLLGTPLTARFALLGAAVFAVSLATLNAWYARSQPADEPGFVFWTFALVGAALTLFSERVARLGMYAATADSWANYEPMGWLLHDTGILTPVILNERSILIPSMHAAGRAFGTEVTFAIYQVLALVLALMTAGLIWTSLKGVARHWRIALAAATVAVLASSPVWIYMSLYVHSHVISATYLLLGVGAVHRSRFVAREARHPWLLLAGLASAGLTLARPDGLAYVFVPVIVYLGAHISRGWNHRDALSYYAPLLGVLWVAFGSAFARLGLWAPPKLSGPVALAALLAITASAFAPALLTRLGEAGRWLASGQRFATMMLAGTGVAVLGLFVLQPDRAQLAVVNMYLNLTAEGGWGIFWFAIPPALLASAAARFLVSPESWRDALGISIAQFFALALLVHTAAHPGRLYWGDSFNRVVFHAVPLVFWYVAVSAGALISELGAARDKPTSAANATSRGTRRGRTPGR